VQALSQHTPSAQWPLAHSESALHSIPSAQSRVAWQGRGTQLDPMHCARAWQSVLAAQLVLQVVAVSQA
jgi:hypothetical protein